MTRKRLVWIIAVFLVAAALAGGICYYQREQSALDAMYLTYGENDSVFVALDSQALFDAAMPEGEIYGADGRHIAPRDLKNGNRVKIYGDGVMMESYPGQYHGVTKIVVTAAGRPEDTKPYQKILADLYREP